MAQNWQLHRPEFSQGLQQEVFDLLHQGAADGPFFSQPCQGATKSFPGLYMVVFFQWDKR